MVVVATVVSATKAILAKKIAEMGRIPFSRFMQLALYGESGYYAQHVQIGNEQGDFFTAAQSCLFGMTLGQYIYRTWREFGEPIVLQVVELGAGQGELALQICQELCRSLPPAIGIRYVIRDPSPVLRKRQRQLFDAHGVLQGRVEVHWGCPNPALDTVLIGNEVLDALPVEVVRRHGRSYERGFVGQDDLGRLYIDFVPAPRRLCKIAEQYLEIPDASQAEICLLYPQLLANCRLMGRRIRVVFVDYGITTDEWREGARPRGTLRGYRRHKIVDVFDAPGVSDLTADVHWDYLQTVARQFGFQTLQLASQGAFLLQAGILSVVERATSSLGSLPPRSLSYARLANELKQLTLPGGMGERFSAFVAEYPSLDVQQKDGSTK